MTATSSNVQGSRGGEAASPSGPLAAIQAEQAVHGEMLRRIIRLLEQEPERDGADLALLLERLIGEIGRNTRAVNLLGEKVATLAQDMPGRIVDAIGASLDPERLSAAENGTETPLQS